MGERDRIQMELHEEEERGKNRGGGFSSGGGETAEFHGRARRKEDEEGGILTGEETLIAVSEEGVRLERKVTRPKREKEEEIREGDPVNCRRSVCYPSAVHAPCKLCSIGYSSSPPPVISFSLLLPSSFSVITRSFKNDYATFRERLASQVGKVFLFFSPL